MGAACLEEGRERHGGTPFAAEKKHEGVLASLIFVNLTSFWRITEARPSKSPAHQTIHGDFSVYY
jgi:hypothetical protein